MSEKIDTTSVLLKDIDTPTTEQSTPDQSQPTTPSSATKRADISAHRLLRGIRSALRAALDDLRHAGWKRVAFCTIAELWVYTLLGGLLWINYAYFMYEYIHSYNTTGGCHLDDSFHAVDSWYQKWSKSGFFQPTWSSGPMSFDSAKGADMAWDIVSCMCLLNAY